MQSQAPPVFIGVLVGPAGAGVYDVLTRLPRAAKSILSLLNSALLPVSARFEQISDRSRMRVLGATGFWLVPALTFPLLIGGAVLAEDLMRVWLGPSLVYLWPWLSLMFIVPLLNILLSFGQTMMQVRSRFLEENNRVALAQIATQFVLSIALVRVLEERAFIAGQVAAALLGFPFQMRLLLREQGLDGSRVLRVFARHAAVAFPLVLIAAVAQRYGLTETVASLIASFVLWCAAYWACAYLLMLSASERAMVRRVFSAARQRG
jgi:O-antigen/teichoic acid export membrane protein